MAVENTLAYHDSATMTAQKSFIVPDPEGVGYSSMKEDLMAKLTPGPNIIKLFTSVIYGFRTKLECLSLASFSSLVYCLWVRPVTYLVVQEHHAGRYWP
jgi:hypothetical protein